jgi:hypothetical protein
MSCQNTKLRCENSELTFKNSELIFKNTKLRCENSELTFKNSELIFKNTKLRCENSELTFRYTISCEVKRLYYMKVEVSLLGFHYSMCSSTIQFYRSIYRQFPTSRLCSTSIQTKYFHEKQ